MPHKQDAFETVRSARQWLNGLRHHALTDTQRELLLNDLERARNTLAWIEYCLETGEVPPVDTTVPAPST
jgi:hypothetical protein